MGEVLDWRTETEPNRLVQRLNESLQAGRLLAVPTEAGYLLVAHALTSGIDLLQQLRPDEPLQLSVGGFDEVALWYTSRTRLSDRLMRRLWPGAASLSLPLSANEQNSIPSPIRERFLDAEGRIRLASFHSLTHQELLDRGMGPLAFVELAEGETHSTTTLQERWGDSLSILLEGGERVSQAFTRVRVEASDWSIERPGAVAHHTIQQAAARWFLFLCTGNTCRSPMAEAIFKVRLAERLQCQVADLPARGYNVLSAGIATHGGDSAAIDAMEMVSRFGADLSRHESQPVTERLVQAADHLIAMTRNHLMTLLARHSPAGTMQLLCGSEGDLDDPIGGGAEVYRQCGETILRHLDRLISEYQLT